MVQSWTPSFLTDQTRPSNVLVWVRLPSLPEGLYNQCLLKFIGETIDLVTKIDRNTDARTRGQFARLAVFVDLNQPLISKIRIDGHIQRVKYESLPIVCFGCGRYGHRREACVFSTNLEKTPMGAKEQVVKEKAMPSRMEGMRSMSHG